MISIPPRDASVKLSSQVDPPIYSGSFMGSSCSQVHPQTSLGDFAEAFGMAFKLSSQVDPSIHRRFLYKGDTSTRAEGTDPRVALGA